MAESHCIFRKKGELSEKLWDKFGETDVINLYNKNMLLFFLVVSQIILHPGVQIRLW